MLGGRGFSVESAAARVCREAGARVSTNVFVRDLDPVVGHDGLRLEVVACHFSVVPKMAIDTTLVSPIRADGLPRRQCADVDGAAEPRAPSAAEVRMSAIFGRVRAKMAAF